MRIFLFVSLLLVGKFWSDDDPDSDDPKLDSDGNTHLLANSRELTSRNKGAVIGEESYRTLSMTEEGRRWKKCKGLKSYL